MSFAFSFRALPDQTVEDSFAEADIPNKEAAIEAAGELLSAALETADELAGLVAKMNEPVQVSISGHYNGGLDPRAGWGSNMLTVSVTQIYNPEP